MKPIAKNFLGLPPNHRHHLPFPLKLKHSGDLSTPLRWIPPVAYILPLVAF